jgi:hypothetical protein
MAGAVPALLASDWRVGGAAGLLMLTPGGVINRLIAGDWGTIRPVPGTTREQVIRNLNWAAPATALLMISLVVANLLFHPEWQDDGLLGAACGIVFCTLAFRFIDNEPDIDDYS